MKNTIYWINISSLFRAMKSETFLRFSVYYFKQINATRNVYDFI